MYKKIGLWALLVLSIFILFTFIIPVSLIPYNSYLFTKFTGDLLSVSGPDSSMVLETEKEFGTLIGNGDHCDYYAALLLKSDLSQDELLEHYNKEYKGDSTIRIIKVNNFKYNSFDYPSPLDPWVKKIRDSKIQDINKLYIIYIFEPFYVSGIGDFRCSI